MQKFPKHLIDIMVSKNDKGKPVWADYNCNHAYWLFLKSLHTQWPNKQPLFEKNDIPKEPDPYEYPDLDSLRDDFNLCDIDGIITNVDPPLNWDAAITIRWIHSSIDEWLMLPID